MYEMPPILQGNERQQIAALRDYLVRMVRANNFDLQAASAPAVVQESVVTVEDTDKIKKNAEQLRQLIIKTADDVKAGYVAQSDFGEYVEKASIDMQTTALNAIENYELTQGVTLLNTIDALSGQAISFDAFKTEFEGQIRRGWIEDPDTHETAFGIAIAKNMKFSGGTHTENEIVYYDLDAGQTLGLYTSDGWQFWVNGRKRGWFDSETGMLHVINIVSTNSFTLSAGWEMTDDNGFGIKYTGA